MVSNIELYILAGVCFMMLFLLTSCSGHSGPNPPGPIPADSLLVQDIKASVLEYTDCIRLTWS
jgi:hypothetical protein